MLYLANREPPYNAPELTPVQVSTPLCAVATLHLYPSVYSPTSSLTALSTKMSLPFVKESLGLLKSKTSFPFACKRTLKRGMSLASLYSLPHDLPDHLLKSYYSTSSLSMLLERSISESACFRQAPRSRQRTLQSCSMPLTRERMLSRTHRSFNMSLTRDPHLPPPKTPRLFSMSPTKGQPLQLPRTRRLCSMSTKDLDL